MTAPTGRRAGDRFVTTAAAAALVQLSPSGFRSLASRARAEGIDLAAPRASWPDGRTPMWDRRLVEQYARARPGRGRRRPAGG